MKTSLFMQPVVACLAVNVAMAGALSKDIAPPKAPKEALSTQPTASRWSVGAGIVFRPMDANFKLSSPGPLSLSRASSGRGDVGFATLGDGVVHYDDGFVGPSYGFGDGNTPDGTAYGQINSAGQLSPTGRVDGSSENIYDLRFHSHRISYDSQYSSNSHEASDSDLGIGPYVELRYVAYQAAAFDVNVFLGYSWVSAAFGSGEGLLATQSLHRTNDRYTYRYDHYSESSGADVGPFPFADTGAYTVVDAGLSNSTGYSKGGNLPPSKSRRSHEKTIATYYLTGQADLDIDLHEIVLAPEISFALLGNRLHVGLSAGPTLNFINSEFQATSQWYKSGTSKPVKTYNFHDSATDVELGVMGQVTASFDLTSRLYIQASGSYRYVSSVDVGGDLANASFDPTSWQSSVGLGFRL
ncbi:hypothetical protein BH11VER1_BH11VER1_35530 [soil metagenome]